MTEKEKRNKLKMIKQTLQVFPGIVRQDAQRGKAHRKLMKAFEPMVKDLVRRIKSKKKPEPWPKLRCLQIQPTRRK